MLKEQRLDVGHFKDETDMKSCEDLEDVKRGIKSYKTYYNHYRGQWNLKEMTPVEYRHHLLQVSYFLNNCLPTDNHTRWLRINNLLPYVYF